MKLPAWLRITDTTRAPDGRSVIVTLTADTTAFTEALARAVEATYRFMWAYERAHAGICARMHVRGALDPAYADPEARNAYVRKILHELHDPDIAAAFLRGWVEHHPAERRHPEAPPAPPLVWHRAFGDTILQVGAA